MPRPTKCRMICQYPQTLEFAPIRDTGGKDAVILTVDEYETIRLIDKEGLSQEQCSQSMQVARTTVQKIYDTARRKLADALVDGCPLRIEGGEYRLCPGGNRFCGMGACYMNQKIRVTVLIENTSDGAAVTSDDALVCEHGLSLFIEYNGLKILLDAGSTEAFSKNADALGIPLAGLDAYVLSHGHYDHSGGFAAVFCRDPAARVYAQKSALDMYLSASGGMHEISVPQQVASQRERFILIEGIREILPGIYLVPHATEGLERIGEESGLYKNADGQIQPDDFAHEQSLVLDTDKGLVIFNSCSHAGAANIIREAKAACGQRRVYAYIGGLHMKPACAAPALYPARKEANGAFGIPELTPLPAQRQKIQGKGMKNNCEICAFSDSEIEELCAFFREEGVEQIYTGHCTGIPGYEKLHARLGERVHKLTTGMRFEL